MTDNSKPGPAVSYPDKNKSEQEKKDESVDKSVLNGNFNLDPRVRDAFGWTYWISLSLVIVSIIVLLYQSLFIGNNDFRQFIQSIALTTLAMSIIFLAGDVVGLVGMPAAIRTAILTSFVVSVLGSAASVVSQAWGSNNGISVKVVLLDEKKVKHFLPENIYCAESHDRRQTTIFQFENSDEFGIFAAIIIKNIAMDADKKVNVSGKVILTSGSKIADYDKISQSQQSITSFDAWKVDNPRCKEKNIVKNLEKIKSEVGLGDKDLLILRFFNKITPVVREDMLRTKQANLILTITDHNKSMSTEVDPRVGITFE